MVIDKDSKFDMYDHFKEVINSLEQPCFHYIMEVLEPYWSQCTRIENKKHLYQLTQLHTLVINSMICNRQINIKRNIIMKRLRQEYADKYHNGDLSKLYQVYPHDKVDLEYPIHCNYWFGMCEPDKNNFDTYYMLARGMDSGSRSNFHLESLLDHMEHMRTGLIRRYL